MPLGSVAATNDLSGLLQKGLFEEEANRNLEAAAQAYSTVSAQFDKDRKLAATAIFRLGEVYRKQGKTNEAAGQYDRIVREFADQDTLVTLSRQNLVGMGSLVTITGLQKTLADEQEAGRLAAQLKGIEQLKDDPQKQAHAAFGLFPDDGLKEKLLALDQWQRQLESSKSSGSNTNTHPDFAAIPGVIASLRRDIKAQVEFIIAAQKARLQLLQAAVGTPPTREGAANERSALATDDEEKEIRRIQAMIQNSPDLINAASGEPRSTPLITAATKGQTRVASFLLGHGADVDLPANASTPLGAAVANGHKAMTELLLSRGADMNGKCYQDQTALHVAADKGFRAVAEVLLANKAQLEARTDKGYTPLHLAAKRGSASLVQFLVSSGANVNAEDNDGITVLSHALASRKPETIRPLLAAKADPTTGKVNLPLLVAIREFRDGDTATLEELIRAGADANKEGRVLWDISFGGNNYQSGGTVTPLCLAVDGNKPEAVKLLLKNKADPNGKNISGFPVLLDAVGITNVLNALLEAGASPDANNGYEYALMKALYYGNSGAVEMLLARGANANMRNSDGRAPLDYAAEQKNKKSVELLVSAKADLNAKTFQGSSALHVAVNQGAKDIVELLLTKGADVNLKNQQGETPLHWAVRFATGGAGNQEMVGLLLAKGADPNIRNNQGLTPLDFANGKTGLPQPGVLVSRPIPTRTLRQPDGSVAPAKPDPASVAALLRQHGALDDLPNLDRIEVRGSETRFAKTVFVKGTNDWNQFTLLEAILNAYSGAGTLLPPGPRLLFPDLHRVVVVRPSRTPGQPPERRVVDLLSPTGDVDCAKDIALEFGDVVEIPERDHTLQESAVGLTDKEAKQMQECRSGKVGLLVRGKKTELKVGPYPTQALVGSVLAQAEARSAVFSTSDLSQVRVTRVNAATGQLKEWLLDCSGGNNPDLWLRDGDVIEVPDKP